MRSAPAEASLLPASVAQLATVIGWPGALALVEAYPGQSLDLPKDIGGEIWPVLDGVLGGHSSHRLWLAYAPGTLYIPACSGLARAERARRIRAEVRDLERTVFTTRAAVTRTARQWRVTDRTIWRILSQDTDTTLAAPAMALFQLPLL